MGDRCFQGNPFETVLCEIEHYINIFLVESNVFPMDLLSSGTLTFIRYKWRI